MFTDTDAVELDNLPTFSERIMVVSVSFIYDQDSRKWAIRISGVESEEEAKQAFNAVLKTIQMTPTFVCMHHRVTPSGDDYLLVPAAL